MERVPGRNTLELWRDDTDDDRDLGQWEGHAVGLAKLLASYTRVGLDSLPASVERPSTWSEYMASCEERWRAIETGFPEPVPLLRYIAGWLEANRPEAVPPLPGPRGHATEQRADRRAGGLLRGGLGDDAYRRPA